MVYRALHEVAHRRCEVALPVFKLQVETVATAFFDRVEDAARAHDALLGAGVEPWDITLAANQTPAHKDLTISARTKAPEGAVSGAALGVGLGVLAGAFTVTGMALLPGVGWVAGPLVGALAGAAVGGTAGGLLGALVGATVPEHEARVVEDAAREGGALIAVHVTDATSERVREVLCAHGGRALGWW